MCNVLVQRRMLRSIMPRIHPPIWPSSKQKEMRQFLCAKYPFKHGRKIRRTPRAPSLGIYRFQARTVEATAYWPTATFPVQIFLGRRRIPTLTLDRSQNCRKLILMEFEVVLNAGLCFDLQNRKKLNPMMAEAAKAEQYRSFDRPSV